MQLVPLLLGRAWEPQAGGEPARGARAAGGAGAAAHDDPGLPRGEARRQDDDGGGAGGGRGGALHVAIKLTHNP
jgi:hypothetical protein